MHSYPRMYVHENLLQMFYHLHAVFLSNAVQQMGKHKKGSAAGGRRSGSGRPARKKGGRMLNLKRANKVKAKLLIPTDSTKPGGERQPTQ